MVLQILAAFAEFERSMISTRVKTNMIDIVQHQKRYMGPPPFGYRYDDKKMLEILPEEADWIRKAADMFITGHGYRGVASWLNSLSIKTKKGKLWLPSSIRQVLTNELYIGRLEWNRSYCNSQGKAQLRDPSEWVVIEDAHPAILSMQQWDAIQKRITRRMPKGGQKQAKRRLSGLMRCGYCGATMVSKKYGTFGPHKDQNIFICSTYQKKASCQFNYAFVDDVDRAVYEALDDLAGGNIDIPEEDLAGASKNLEDDFARRGDAIDQHFQRQIMAFEKGLIFERDLALARDRVEKEREHLEEEKKRVDHGPNRQEIVKAITGQAKQLLWLWENGELAVIQNAVRLILDSVVVKDGQVIDIRLSKELFSPE
jgi:site-specific DNA recombinase